jgi:alpha-L-fucosidase 2
VSLPDDYLENLWYINAYQIAAAARGPYPPHFIGSLWSWNRDCRPWNHYYHWNQQQYTWPLHASGHADLMLPYASWKLEGLERARRAAQQLHGCGGAYYSDVSNRRGDQGASVPGMARNTAPTAFTAMDLWRHYEYTLDHDFLVTFAYPVLREVVRFYVGKLERWDDGRYHIPEALPNESQMTCLSSDTTTDLAGIRKLFPAFVQASSDLGADDDLRGQAREMLANLADFVVATVPENAITWGDVKPGDPVMGFGTMLSSGQPGEPWVVRPYWRRDAPMDFPCSYHAISAQMTPLFPAGLLDMDDADTALLQACRNAALSFDPAGANGHTPLPICLARLGLGELLPDVLDTWIDRYQLFPQGLFCYFRRDYREEYEKGNRNDPYSASEHQMLGLTNDVRVHFSDPGERVGLPRRPFAHVGLEAGSVLQTTVNEMLLQSHSGRIRVFPAVPADWSCSFRLHAVGAFEVVARCLEGTTTCVSIHSHKGGTCRLVNPWPGAAVEARRQDSGTLISPRGDHAELCFETEPGITYAIQPAAGNAADSAPDAAAAPAPRNAGAKARGRAWLGIPRQF